MSDEIYNYIQELAQFKFEFVDEKDNYHKLDSYVKEIFDDYILIYPPNNKGVSFEIPDNIDVNLIFTQKIGIFVAQCVVLGKVFGEKSGIKISFPYKTKLFERREYIRLPMKLKIEVICYQDKTYKNQDSFFAVTRNISASGLAYFYKESLKDYYDIQCKIYLDDGKSNPIITGCDHIYSQKIKIKDEIYYLTALAYTSLSNEDSARIVKECFKYQIKHKKLED